jgi:hypothetical protein
MFHESPVQEKTGLREEIMMTKSRQTAKNASLRCLLRILASFWLLLAVDVAPKASDHGDTPFLVGLGAHEARITGFHAFTRGDRLVLALSSNPAIPSSVTSYEFPANLIFEILIDNDSPVSVDDPLGIGGTVIEPSRIHEDHIFRITFNDHTPRVHHLPRSRGPQQPGADDLLFFAGLRDDPFIRGPRIGKNVAAIVLEVPLASVLGDQSTLLIWATSMIRDVETPNGRIADSAALPLRNQFPENLVLNDLHPHLHRKKTGLAPDVMIFDTLQPAAFPNGRDLADDVVDLVGDPRPLGNDDPFPSENDVPFLNEFPYLAQPHAP